MFTAWTVTFRGMNGRPEMRHFTSLDGAESFIAQSRRLDQCWRLHTEYEVTFTSHSAKPEYTPPGRVMDTPGRDVAGPTFE